MKKSVLLVFIILLIPILIVKADGDIKCNSGEIFDISSCNENCNFQCTGIESDDVTFSYNDKNVDYLKLDSDKKTIKITDRNIEFDPSFEYGIINIRNGSKTGIIKIKNKAYVKEEKTTTTTTTSDPNIKTITVLFDPNNGNDVIEKTCKIASGSNTCSVTMPKLDDDEFNGWGTAKTCTNGNSGSIRVEKDTTYYACYNNTNESDNDNLYIESLEILDNDTLDKIKFGNFSRKKKEYEFKVLYEVENLKINATYSEDIEVEITGNDNLSVGENEVIIKLTKDSETIEYKLLVTRLEEGETINSVHYLKSLVIGGYESQFKFDKDIFIYNLRVDKDINKLEITAKTLDEDDEYEIKNNSDLVNGSKVEIIVTGEEDETTIYTINIIKDENDNMMIYLIIGGIVLLIIVLIILIIIRKNKIKKNKIEPQVLTDEKKDIDILDI